jgi:hypothetical protein
MRQPNRKDLTMTIVPQSVRDLPEGQFKHVPPIHLRQSYKVDQEVRIRVLIDGNTEEFPWLTITEVTAAGYIGCVRAAYGFKKLIEAGTVIAFTADNIVEY